MEAREGPTGSRSVTSVFRIAGVGVAERHAADHHLVGQAELLRDDAVELREGGLRAGVQPGRAAIITFCRNMP